MSILYPKLYLKKVEDITIEILKKNNIELVILDVDNTLIDIYRKLSPKIIDWAEEMKKGGIKLYILSNTNSKEKVEKVANDLKLEYKNLALKPLKRGFKYVQRKFKINPQNIAVVGDQIFTDVICGNRCKMFTILV